jgi:hypothetical protein
MTWGGTNFFFIEIVTLETGDMPQKVLFRPIAEAPCQKKIENLKFNFYDRHGSYFCIKVLSVLTVSCQKTEIVNTELKKNRRCPKSQ